MTNRKSPRRFHQLSGPPVIARPADLHVDPGAVELPLEGKQGSPRVIRRGDDDDAGQRRSTLSDGEERLVAVFSTPSGMAVMTSAGMPSAPSHPDEIGTAGYVFRARGDRLRQARDIQTQQDVLALAFAVEIHCLEPAIDARSGEDHEPVSGLKGSSMIRSVRLAGTRRPPAGLMRGGRR